MEAGPLASEMTRRILAWSSVDDFDAADDIVRGAMVIVAAGGVDRQFQKWCDSIESPWQLGRLDEASRKLLFNSIALESYSSLRLKDMREATFMMPLWRYWCGSIYCAPHASLEGFVARFDDRIWETIYPPNGWMCGCSVAPMLESDLKNEKLPTSVADPRVLKGCRGWLDEDLQRVYDLLR